MLASSTHQSTIENALHFYKEHIESRRLQEQQQLPNNGKSPVTEADLDRDRAHAAEQQAIHDLLASLVTLSGSPQTVLEERKVPDPPPKSRKPEQPRYDAFDSEPYLNPLSGEWIFPVTPYTPGPSKSANIQADTPATDPEIWDTGVEETVELFESGEEAHKSVPWSRGHVEIQSEAMALDHGVSAKSTAFDEITLQDVSDQEPPALPPAKFYPASSDQTTPVAATSKILRRLSKVKSLTSRVLSRTKSTSQTHLLESEPESAPASANRSDENGGPKIASGWPSTVTRDGSSRDERLNTPTRHPFPSVIKERSPTPETISEWLLELDDERGSIPQQSSLELAFALSEGLPQDYSDLTQIYNEHEASVREMESWKLAKELAGGVPQDPSVLLEIQTQNESLLERLRVLDAQIDGDVEADRRFAQSLADNIPQDAERLYQAEVELHNQFLQEANAAREMSERQDQADLEAQLRAIAQMQEEWNTSEARVLAQQQDVARAVAEQQDRLELKQMQDTGASGMSGRTPESQVAFNPARPSHGPTGPVQEGSYSSPPPMPGAFDASAPNTAPPVYTPTADDPYDDLARAIAERRQRHAEWQAQARQSEQAAAQLSSELRRLETEQRLAHEEARRRAAEEAQRQQREEEQREAERRARQVECAACHEPSDKSAMAILPCKHTYDADCIEQAFQHALKSKKPFTCCGKVRIPVELVANFLSPDLITAYRAFLIEYGTPNPTYCSNKRCSAFVPPSSLAGDVATCPKCSTQTCRLCRSARHKGVCQSDAHGLALLGLADKKLWQTCPNCSMLVEKSEGCLHMRCMCGTEFCYNCGRKYGRCGGTCKRR